MSWTVTFTSTARRGVKKLPEQVCDVLDALQYDLENSGPVQTEWANYGKITGQRACHHCHLLRGRPTYVAVWRELSGNEIEVVVCWKS